jgi:hypothetical protein
MRVERTQRSVVLVAAGLVLALAGIGVGIARSSGSEPEPVVEAAPAPAPVPAPAPASPPPPRPAPPPPPPAPGAEELLAEEYGIADLAAAGIRVEDDDLDLITGIFRDGYDHLADEGEWRRWTTNFAPRPPAFPDDGFVEGAVVVLDPRRPCVDFHRQIQSVESGIPDEAGDRMEAALLAATGPRPFPYVGAEDVPGSFPQCLDPAKGEWWGKGYVLDEIVPIRCALPGRDLRCFVVTRWSYTQAAASSWVAEAFVFDGLTGERIAGAALHPGISAERLDRLARLALHVDGGVPLAADGGPVPALPTAPDATSSVLPTDDGVKVLWLDDARSLSDLDLDDRWVHVPWAVVSAG